MTLQDVLDHFGTVTETATALGLTSQAVGQWSKKVPALRQKQIEELTEGALKASANIYKTTKTTKAA